MWRLRAGLINQSFTVFDYGCGHGQDIALLAEQGIACEGWDPEFRPHSPKYPADVVNLGFVLNVIEDVRERAEALRQAWNLARRLLIVAAQVKETGRGKSQSAFGDGVLTGLGTFQKYFAQSELKAFLEAELQSAAIPASLGIYYLFKDETLQQQFLANRYRRRSPTPRKRISELRFEEHRELLEALMGAVAELGRLPDGRRILPSTGIGRETRLREASVCIGSSSDRPHRVGRHSSWSSRRSARLPRTGPVPQAPALGQLPRTLQRDMREFFGSYTKACRESDELLFRAGNAVAIDEACRRSPVGKLLPDDLYVHRKRIDTLEPLLRALRGLRPGLPRRSRWRERYQDSPEVRQAFVPDLSRLRYRSTSGATAMIRVSLRSAAQIDSDDYAIARTRRSSTAKNPSSPPTTPSTPNSPA